MKRILLLLRATARSGMESVGIRRDCNGRGGTCRDDRATKPGKYVVQICAYGKRRR